MPLSTLVYSRPAETPKNKATPITKPPTQPPSIERPKAVTPEVHAGTEARHQLFNEISKAGQAQLVFLGDSITEGWESSGSRIWEQHYASRKAANFGVSGDRTEHVLWRLDHGNFDGLTPKLIVVLIGTNNTRHRQDSGADTAAGVQAILDRLTLKCPDAKVLLMAIFPRGENTDDPLRVLNNEANKSIEKIADGKRVIFKDIGALFTEADGTLKQSLMPDLRHPNEQGYAVWADAIEADVVALLDEAKPNAKPNTDPKRKDAVKPASPQDGKPN